MKNQTSRVIENESVTDKTLIGYVRVSHADQNEARQLEAFKNLDLFKIFIEKISAKDTNRPMLQNMLDYVRSGDTVYIKDFSRLARSTKDLLNITEKLDSKGVKLISIKESLDTSTATGNAFRYSVLTIVLLIHTKFPTFSQVYG
jgi:DNA invertase Pin-like site-specific DNA recombinase